MSGFKRHLIRQNVKLYWSEKDNLKTSDKTIKRQSEKKFNARVSVSQKQLKSKRKIN
jgi:hypothetical protein